MKRDSTGKFVAVRQGLEETFSIITIIYRITPLLIILLFVMNYFRVWGVLKNYGALIINIGNPDCSLTCIGSNEGQV